MTKSEYIEKLEKLGLERKWWTKSILPKKSKKSWDKKPYHILEQHLFLNRSLNNIWNVTLVDMLIEDSKILYMDDFKKKLDVLLLERLIFEIPEFKLFRITMHSSGTMNDEYEYPFKNATN